MTRVLDSPMAETMQRLYFPAVPMKELRGLGARVDGWFSFQKYFIKPAMDLLVSTSSDGFSISGFERIKKDRRYVFISNHRDIVCDPALFTYGLHRSGWESPFICLGDNLLVNPWIVDLVKMNRGVTVKRSLSARELLLWSKELSSVINQAVRGNEASVWIAQREGRAKDGVDETNPGVLKMLALSQDGEILDALDGLHLAPVAVSYEYDPCDALKARELHELETNGTYVKSPGEDVRSMAKGIRDPKGRIHIEIGAEIDDVVRDARALPSRKEQLQFVATALDRRMRELYRVWPTARVAAAWLEQGRAPQSSGAGYTAAEAGRFAAWVERQLDEAGAGGEARDAIRRKMLEMYARPLDGG